VYVLRVSQKLLFEWDLVLGDLLQNFPNTFNFGSYRSNIYPTLHEVQIRLCTEFLRNG